MDHFSILHSGQLINTYRPKELHEYDNLNPETKARKLSDAIEKHSNDKIISHNEGKISDYSLYKIIQSYSNFISVLEEKEYEANHEILWDLISIPNEHFLKNGLNIILLNISHDDLNERIDIVCPTSNYSQNFFNKKKPSVITTQTRQYI